jgi:hypothetical protein
MLRPYQRQRYRGRLRGDEEIMSGCCPPPPRSEGGDWIIVRRDPARATESYYMAGCWIADQRFGKRIRGYGNALAVLDRAPKEAPCTYGIGPVPRRRRRARQPADDAENPAAARF